MCDPVPEVETDVANSESAGDVVNDEPVFFYQVKQSGPGPLSFYEVVFFELYKQLFLKLKL